MAVSLGFDIYGFDKSCLICLPMVSGCVLVKRLLVIRLEPVRLSLLHAELTTVICQKRLKRLLAETALMDTARDHGPASRR